ncbi:MAG: hypothetical protein KatS3mg077_0766 [Candidatus Binatia bacterium]|nr:MAG: hypothetical protein KatS3mg077_0766 [Candidatus Binatia bacterium]
MLRRAFAVLWFVLAVVGVEGLRRECVAQGIDCSRTVRVATEPVRARAGQEAVLVVTLVSPWFARDEEWQGWKVAALVSFPWATAGTTLLGPVVRVAGGHTASCVAVDAPAYAGLRAEPYPMGCGEDVPCRGIALYGELRRRPRGEPQLFRCRVRVESWVEAGEYRLDTLQCRGHYQWACRPWVEEPCVWCPAVSVEVLP